MCEHDNDLTKEIQNANQPYKDMAELVIRELVSAELDVVIGVNAIKERATQHLLTELGKLENEKDGLDIRCKRIDMQLQALKNL